MASEAPGRGTFEHPRMRGTFDPEALLQRAMRGEVACGDLEIRIDRRGEWYHQGSRIARPELVRLFSRVLHRAADGSFWLITPVEQGRVEVEDAPFVAVELAQGGSGRDQRLAFRTNLDTWVTASAANALRCRDRPDGQAPYLELRPGIEARVIQSVFYELVQLAVQAPNDPALLGVWSDEVFFPLGQAGADD